MVDWACQLTDEDLEGYRYRLSDPTKEVPLMTEIRATFSETQIKLQITITAL